MIDNYMYLRRYSIARVFLFIMRKIYHARMQNKKYINKKNMNWQHIKKPNYAGRKPNRNLRFYKLTSL